MRNLKYNWFRYSAGVVFLITACAKLFSASGSAVVLQQTDPIFHLKFNILFYTAGIAELVIAAICMLGKSKYFAVAAVMWFSTCLAIYRATLWWIGWSRPCSCLGNFTDAIHISPQSADIAMKFTLMYLLVGSYIALVRYAKNRIESADGSKQSL